MPNYATVQSRYGTQNRSIHFSINVDCKLNALKKKKKKNPLYTLKNC